MGWIFTSSDDLNNPLVFSTGAGNTEQVSINGNGVFYISITADLNQNGSKYALIVEEQASTSSFVTSSARQSNKSASGKKFDTGEFIIMKKDKSIEAIKSFNELPHRLEFFYQKNNKMHFFPFCRSFQLFLCNI